MPQVRMRDRRDDVRFTNVWFEQVSKPLWEEHIRPLAPFPTYLEIGVCEGQSMLYALRELGVERAIGLDPWIPKREKHRRETRQNKRNCYRNLKEYIERDQVRIYQKLSLDFFLNVREPWLEGGLHLDLAFVDGSHWAWDTLLDMQHAWRLMKVGGVMIVDDLDRRIHRQKPLTWQAVTSFMISYSTKYKLIYMHNKQCAFRKVEK